MDGPLEYRVKKRAMVILYSSTNWLQTQLVRNTVIKGGLSAQCTPFVQKWEKYRKSLVKRDVHF